MRERVVLILQARMGSSRLPGKAMRPLAGQPLLSHVMRRCVEAKTLARLDQCILATSVAEQDRALVSLADEQEWPVYAGPEHDVLERVRGAAVSARADVVVRVTGDCPLLAPDVVAEVVRCFFDQPIRTDYLSNDTSSTGWPDGMDVEVFTMQVLDAAAAGAYQQHDREHVTPWIRRSGTWGALGCPHGDYAFLKLSVDTAEDLERVRSIYAHLLLGGTSFADTMRAVAATTTEVPS